MRLLIIPFILAIMLVYTPISAQSTTNQEAAEKIVNSIDGAFPDIAVDVFYKGGEVWLKGETSSPEQRKKVVEHVFSVSGVRVDKVNDEMQVFAPKVEAKVPVVETQAAPVAKPAVSAVTAPVPVPRTGTPAPLMANQVKQSPQAQGQQAQGQQVPAFAGAVLAPYPYAHYQAAYGMAPGQQSAVPAPYTPTNYAVPPQAAQQQPAPQYGHQHQPAQHQPAYYGPPAGAVHHPEAYGQQGPLPGQYNQPNLPNYAWPAYANYPNYAQVSYPRMYSPKAWPYIGPFYPYPQVPLGWRKVTLEHHNGWWCLDFDDGSSSGPFSGLFRQPTQYTY